MRLNARTMTAWVAVAMLGGLVAPHAAAAQSGSNAIGIRLVDAPANGTVDPRAKLYIVENVAPGGTIHRRVEVANSTPNPLTIQLYAAGAQLEQGQFKPLDGRTANDLAGWTSVTPPSIDLAPNTKSTAMVDIAVPSDAPGGERYAAVWAELPPTRSGGVTNVNRVGVRMYLSVGGGAEPASDFTVSGLRAGRNNAGHQIVTADVANTGGRAVDVVGQLRLTGRGLDAGPYPSTGTVTLSPTQQATLSVSVRPRVPRGPWDATLTATSGSLARTANGRLVFANAPPASTGADYGWLWVVLAAAGLVVLGGLFLVFRRRMASPAVSGRHAR
jgi:hypothetical protein